MSAPTPTATDPVAAAGAYIAGLLAALGSRPPLEVLAETPGALSRLVAGLSPAQQRMPEASGKWSVRQVVQHLADAELVGGFRIRMVLAHDAPELPGYDQDLWAQRLGYQDSDPEVAIREFTSLRESNLRLYRRATPADLSRVMRHAERGDESLAEIISVYAGHDLVHRRQLDRITRAIGAFH